MAKVYQPSPKVLAARENGRKGGLARAAKLTAARRSEIASKGGSTTLASYGSAFYSFVCKKRKRVGRNRTLVE